MSDLSLVSCTLNSEAHPRFPLTLATLEVALPLIGERLWAVGFRHQHISDQAALVTPLVSSGLVTAAFPRGRGERMASPCFEVEMETVGGMSGGAVVNANGHVVGVVSSSFEGGPSYVTLIWEALRLEVKGTIAKLAAFDRVSIHYAKSVGVARLKGNINRKPWGDIRIEFSDAEKELFAKSIPADAVDDPPQAGLSDDELEAFVDEWGSEMESVAGDAAMELLANYSLERFRNLLASSNVPEACLAAIEAFSVEDFEGVEDPDVVSTEKLNENCLRLEYFFGLQALIFTLKVPQSAYSANESEFRAYFTGIESDGDIASLDLIQRCYFKATILFDGDTKLFTDVVINWTAVRRRERPAGIAE